MAYMPVLKIGGKDFTPLLLSGGVKYSRNDIDSANAGRTHDTVMHRNRKGTKVKLTFSLRRLDMQQAQELAAAIAPQYFDVTYLDFAEGVQTKTFYASPLESAILRVTEDGGAYWNGTTFSVIER